MILIVATAAVVCVTFISACDPARRSQDPAANPNMPDTTVNSGSSRPDSIQRN